KIAGSGTKRLDIGGGGALQCGRRVTGSGERVQFAEGMGLPDLRPLILQGACEETQGLAVLAFVGEPAKAFAGLDKTRSPAESDALELARFDIVGVEAACVFEDGQRVTRPVESDKRARRCAQRLEFEHAVGRLLGKHENVTGTLLSPR